LKEIASKHYIKCSGQLNAITIDLRSLMLQLILE